MIHVADLLMELYLPEHGMSSNVDQLFADMKRRLDEEARYIETLMELQGAVDLVLSCSPREEASQKVVHTVAQMPKLSVL